MENDLAELLLTIYGQSNSIYQYHKDRQKGVSCCQLDINCGKTIEQNTFLKMTPTQNLAVHHRCKSCTTRGAYGSRQMLMHANPLLTLRNVCNLDQSTAEWSVLYPQRLLCTDSGRSPQKVHLPLSGSMPAENLW
jgi:hypothetical protein